MKRFFKFFVLEFALIFIVSTMGYWLFRQPFNFLQIILSSATAGAVISYALVATNKNPY